MKLQSVLLVLALTVTSGLISSMITSRVSAQFAQPTPATQPDIQATIPPSLPGATPPGLPSNLPPGLPSSFPALPPGMPMISSIIMPQMPGRYHMALEQMHNSNNTLIVICDTATGQCWNGQVGSSSWNDMGTPIKATGGTVFTDGGTVFTDGGVKGQVILGNNPPPAAPAK